MHEWHGTTILAVQKNGKTVLGGDGQVSMGDTVLKGKAQKIRRLYNDSIITGFAGGTADAITMFERFEEKVQQYSGNVPRAAIELAKDWRLDKALRHLEALMIVADRESMFIISGKGDVMQPDDNVIGVGSGGNYAAAAARALLLKAPKLSAKEIVTTALTIASEICIYTNDNITIEEV